MYLPEVPRQKNSDGILIASDLSQDFLLAALASLLFSKILWLPSPGNENCRSSETCDYGFFSLNHTIYLSLNILFLCFLIFMVAAMPWVSIPPGSHPAAGACLGARCPLHSARPSSEQTLPSLGGLFCLYILKMKVLKGFSLTG